MERSEIRKNLESKTNFVHLIRSICDEYNLDTTLKTNIVNIKAFLTPINVDSILKDSSSLEAANKSIIKLYGDRINSKVSSIPDNINETRAHLLNIINSPGGDATNTSVKYKTTADGFSNRSTNGRAEYFGSAGLAGSILDLPQTQRIEAVKYLNYQSLFRDEFVIIDSRYQNKVNPDPTRMRFSLIGTSKKKSDHGGVIIGRQVKDIVEIEVYPFTIPYKPTYVTFYNKITLAINEWASNAFEAYEGGQFHIGFDIERVDNNLIYLRPINPIYSFSSPMNYVDDFTLSFGAMLPKISFDPDRMFPSSIDYANPYGLFIFSDAHNLVTGDLVHITDFNTPDPARDAVIISEVNRPAGHTIVKKDNYTFVVNIDLTPLVREEPVDSGIFPILDFVQEAQVFFASKRVQIQMRMRYLTSYT